MFGIEQTQSTLNGSIISLPLLRLLMVQDPLTKNSEELLICTISFLPSSLSFLPERISQKSLGVHLHFSAHDIEFTHAGLPPTTLGSATEFINI